MENQSGQDVEELKILLHGAEAGIEVGQQRAIVLED